MIYYPLGGYRGTIAKFGPLTKRFLGFYQDGAGQVLKPLPPVSDSGFVVVDVVMPVVIVLAVTQFEWPLCCYMCCQ